LRFLEDQPLLKLNSIRLRKSDDCVFLVWNVA
jgi:hypothetical protein